MVLWYPVSDDSFHFRSWDDDGFAVVYIVDNGDTHLIESMALELLRLIQVSPRTAESMATSLADIFSSEEYDAILDSVNLTLFKLLDVGLVTCV